MKGIIPYCLRKFFIILVLQTKFTQTIDPRRKLTENLINAKKGPKNSSDGLIIENSNMLTTQQSEIDGN